MVGISLSGVSLLVNNFVRKPDDDDLPFGRAQFEPFSMTLQSAVMACGGFTEYANQKQVQLMQDGKQSIHNFNDIRKNPSKDVPLKPGDNIWVPQSFW